MACHLPPDDPPLLAVAAFDEFIADIVRHAHKAGLHVPSRLFDWAVGEGTRLVERRSRQGLIAPGCTQAVRAWASPWIAALFPELRPVLPPLDPPPCVKPRN
jgi:hypothetical protein